MAKRPSFSDAFRPIPTRRTSARVTAAPKIRPRKPRSLRRALKDGIGGLKRERQRSDTRTFIQRSRDVSSEQKAMWHNVTGAGKSHVVREFFGLSDDEQNAAKAALEKAIEQRVRAHR
jgi:hypothetical protein